MSPMVPGLGGGKMSSSDPNSKIDLLDPPEVVRKKIKAAVCAVGNITDNGILAFVQAVLIPISEMYLERRKDKISTGKLDEAAIEQTPFASGDAPEGTVFTIDRSVEHGGPAHYSSFEDLQKDFAEEKLHPGDLKTSVTNAIIKLLQPIRKAFEANEDWQNVEKLAYPDPNANVEKKKKKVYNTQHDVHLKLTTRPLQEKVYHPPPPGKGKNAKVKEVLTNGAVNLPDPAPNTVPNA